MITIRPKSQLATDDYTGGLAVKKLPQAGNTSRFLFLKIKCILFLKVITTV